MSNNFSPPFDKKKYSELVRLNYPDYNIFGIYYNSQKRASNLLTPITPPMKHKTKMKDIIYSKHNFSSTNTSLNQPPYTPALTEGNRIFCHNKILKTPIPLKKSPLTKFVSTHHVSNPIFTLENHKEGNPNATFNIPSWRYTTKLMSEYEKMLSKPKNKPKGSNDSLFSQVSSAGLFNYPDEIEKYKEYLHMVDSNELLRAKAREILSPYYKKKEVINQKGYFIKPNYFFDNVCEKVMRLIETYTKNHEELNEDLIINMLIHECDIVKEEVDYSMNAYCNIKNFSLAVHNNSQIIMLPLINSIRKLTQEEEKELKENHKKNVGNKSMYNKALFGDFKLKTELMPIDEKHTLDDEFDITTHKRLESDSKISKDKDDVNILKKKSLWDVYNSVYNSKKVDTTPSHLNNNWNNSIKSSQANTINLVDPNGNEIKYEDDSNIKKTISKHQMSTGKVQKRETIHSINKKTEENLANQSALNAYFQKKNKSKSRKNNKEDMIKTAATDYKKILMSNIDSSRQHHDKNSNVNNNTAITNTTEHMKDTINNIDKNKAELSHMQINDIDYNQNNQSLEENNTLNQLLEDHQDKESNEDNQSLKNQNLKNQLSGQKKKQDKKNVKTLINSHNNYTKVKAFEKKKKSKGKKNQLKKTIDNQNNIHQDQIDLSDKNDQSSMKSPTHRKNKSNQSNQSYHSNTKLNRSEHNYIDLNNDNKNKDIMKNSNNFNKYIEKDNNNKNTKIISQSTKTLINLKFQSPKKQGRKNQKNSTKKLDNNNTKNIDLDNNKILPNEEFLKLQEEEKVKEMTPEEKKAYEKKKEESQYKMKKTLTLFIDTMKKTKGIDMSIFGELYKISNDELLLILEDKDCQRKIKEFRNRLPQDSPLLLLSDLEFIKYYLQKANEPLPKVEAEAKIEKIMISRAKPQTKTSTLLFQTIDDNKEYKKIIPKDIKTKKMLFGYPIKTDSKKPITKKDSLFTDSQMKYMDDSEIMKIMDNTGFNITLKDSSAILSMQTKIRELSLGKEIEYQMSLQESEEGKERFQDLMNQIKNLKTEDSSSYINNLTMSYKPFQEELSGLIEAKDMEDRLNRFLHSFGNYRLKQVTKRQIFNNQLKVKDYKFITTMSKFDYRNEDND